MAIRAYRGHYAYSLSPGSQERKNSGPGRLTKKLSSVNNTGSKDRTGNDGKGLEALHLPRLASLAALAVQTLPDLPFLAGSRKLTEKSFFWCRNPVPCGTGR